MTQIPYEKLKRYRYVLNRVATEDPENTSEVQAAMRILRQMEEAYPGIREQAFEGGSANSGVGGSAVPPFIQDILTHALQETGTVVKRGISEFLNPTPPSEVPVPKEKEIKVNKPSAKRRKIDFNVIDQAFGSVKEFERRIVGDPDERAEGGLTMDFAPNDIDAVVELYNDGDPIDVLENAETLKARCKAINRIPALECSIYISLDVLLALASEKKATLVGQSLLATFVEQLEEALNIDDDEDGEEDEDAEGEE